MGNSCRVFSKTLANGNSKNELDNKTEEEKQEEKRDYVK